MSARAIGSTSSRFTVSIVLSDEDRIALRQLLIAEGRSMADFFAQCAKKYLKKHNRLSPSADIEPSPGR